MKIYSIIITVIAAIAIGTAGYLYWSQGVMRDEIADLKLTNDDLGKDKALVENQLTRANEVLDKINQSNEVFKTVVNSFMFAGDIKALTVGLKEGELVDQAIANVQDTSNRMGAEKDWADFKETLGFNPLFGLLRNIANSINQEITNLNGPNNNLPGDPPPQQ